MSVNLIRLVAAAATRTPSLSAVIRQIFAPDVGAKFQVKHPARILFARSEDGFLSVIRKTVPLEIEQDKWFYEATTEYLERQTVRDGRIYEWKGTIQETEPGVFRFRGNLRRIVTGEKARPQQCQSRYEMPKVDPIPLMEALRFQARTLDLSPEKWDRVVEAVSSVGEPERVPPTAATGDGPSISYLEESALHGAGFQFVSPPGVWSKSDGDSEVTISDGLSINDHWWEVQGTVNERVIFVDKGHTNVEIAIKIANVGLTLLPEFEADLKRRGAI